MSYRKHCPTCNRLFTHPPAFAIHRKSCGNESPTLSPPRSPRIAPINSANNSLWYADDELLNSEIQFISETEREAFNQDLEAVTREKNAMVSDNIMVDFGWDPEEKPWAEQEPISAYDDVPPQAVSPHNTLHDEPFTQSAEETTDHSTDFDSDDSADTPLLSPAADEPAEPPPVEEAPRAVRAKQARLPDNVDKKYAELLTRMPTHADETCLQAYSLDELRFLLRKNGTSSHNMLKQPVVNALMHLINTTGLKPSVEAAEPQKRRRVMGTRPASTRRTAGQHRSSRTGAPSRTASSGRSGAPAAAAHGSGHRVAPRPAPMQRSAGVGAAPRPLALADALGQKQTLADGRPGWAPLQWASKLQQHEAARA